MNLYDLNLIDNTEKVGNTHLPFHRQGANFTIVFFPDSTFEHKYLYLEEAVLPTNKKIELDQNFEFPPMREFPSGIPLQTPELDWLQSHSSDLQPYEGQWVVLHNEKLIAHSQSLREVTSMARKRGIKKPLVFRVPQEDPNIEIIGL
jgi:hypothetical protein